MMFSPCNVLIIPSSQVSLTDKLVARWFGQCLKLIEERNGLYQELANGRPWATSIPYFCTACKLKTVFTVLNGWKNFKGEYFWCMQIIENSNLVSTNKVILELSHAPLFFFNKSLLVLSCNSTEMIGAVEIAKPASKLFTFWSFIEKVCLPPGHMYLQILFPIKKN